MTPKELSDLQEAVTAMVSCPCSHSGTSKVHEMMDGKTVWQGEVETFALDGHPFTERAFAWSYVDDAGETQYVCIMERPPIHSPRDAVQVAIASGKLK